MAMDVAGRLPKLRAVLEEAEYDALVVTNLTNVRYLTGFTGSAALLLVTPTELVLATDGRYKFQSAEQLAAVGVDARIEIGNVAEQKQKVSDSATGIGRIGLEAGDVSWARQRGFASDWFSHAELVATDGVIERLRRVKDEGELDRMREAARVADEALANVRPLLAGGITERDFAIALDFEIRKLGASGNSFETIVAAGPNGAKPHARPSSRVIEAGELVVLDFGAIVDGYCSDMTRTVCAGEPSPELQKMVDVVAASQRAGVAAVKAGVSAADVDKVCRDVIADAGWAEAFMHSTGHGVGLDIHEAPWVSATSTDTLASGHVVTVEPGVYLEGLGGVRIEDTVVVTDDGCYPLTHTTKELAVAWQQ
ncbi:MAG: aminopeptidase P family protein [Acidimicrobiales bacterium]|nr:aminopeptidase P family protein [Acidimicrobiales bacterium]